VIKFVSGQWFSPGTPVSLTNKTDRHDIAEILLKVALIIIEPTNQFRSYVSDMAKLSEIDFIFNSVLAINGIVLSLSFYDYP
jgi:hypothetical protein